MTEAHNLALQILSEQPFHFEGTPETIKRQKALFIRFIKMAYKAGKDSK